MNLGVRGAERRGRGYVGLSFGFTAAKFTVWVRGLGFWAECFGGLGLTLS